MSNKPWSEKRQLIEQHSLLRLTTSSILSVPAGADHPRTDDQWTSSWDEDRIRARGLWLAEIALEVWPRPSGGPGDDWSGSTATEAAVGARRTYSVGLRDLIAAGLLSPDEELVWPRRDSTLVARVTLDGRIALSDGTVHGSPSGAATAASGGGSFDGWVLARGWIGPADPGRLAR